MKKHLLLFGISVALLLSGCNANKQPEKQPVEEKQTTEMNDANTDSSVQEETAEIEVKKEQQSQASQNIDNIPFTYYRVVPSQIEVFSYRNLNNSTVIDDTKLNDSFYLKGNYIRIEKILTSKIGDKYGKIAGKSLLVSMDDLEIKQ